MSFFSLLILVTTFHTLWRTHKYRKLSTEFQVQSALEPEILTLNFVLSSRKQLEIVQVAKAPLHAQRT